MPDEDLKTLNSEKLLGSGSRRQPHGVFQSDIVIRSALLLALEDMRARPELLDDAFGHLLDDEVTRAVYGDKILSRVKEWFTATNIPVVMDYRLADVEAVCLSINLASSDEADPTLGDVNYDPYEVGDPDWAPLTSPFFASYDPQTGWVIVPQEAAPGLTLLEGMIFVDAQGIRHTVLEAGDEMVRIQAGLAVPVKACVLLSGEPRQATLRESLRFRETYRIGAHIHGDANHLTWLHTILVYILLRYKEILLEARGFEASTISSSGFGADSAFQGENFWTRFVNVTGYVRHYWGKVPQERLTQVSAKQIVVKPAGYGGQAVPEPGVPEDDVVLFTRDVLGR